MFSSFLGMKSEIVNDINFFIMPILLIFLESVLNFLKKKISLPSFLKKMLNFQFTCFLLLHIFLALYFSLKENSEVDGFLGILVLSSGYLFILGRFGLIKSLLFSASCLIFFLFLKSLSTTLFHFLRSTWRFIAAAFILWIMFNSQLMYSASDVCRQPHSRCNQLGSCPHKSKVFLLLMCRIYSPYLD